MKFIFLDDSKQRKCSREAMGPLVGVGGLIVDANEICAIEKEIEELCSSYDLCKTDVFKWSPSTNDKFRTELVGAPRNSFLIEVLEICFRRGSKAVVSICDTDKKRANNNASDHEMDALLLTLERFHTSIGQDTGIAIIAKPSGGNKEENKMLSECVEHNNNGTNYVEFKRLAMNPLICPFQNSRILQASDLVVSVTTAMVSGHVDFAKTVFPTIVKNFVENRRGLIGGTGLKIHPSSYTNLYHWLIDEQHHVKAGSTTGLPDASYPYFDDPKRKRSGF